MKHKLANIGKCFHAIVYCNQQLPSFVTVQLILDEHSIHPFLSNSLPYQPERQVWWTKTSCPYHNTQKVKSHTTDLLLKIISTHTVPARSRFLYFISQILCSATIGTKRVQTRQNRVLILLAAKQVGRGEACVIKIKSYGRRNLEREGKRDSFDALVSFKNGR